MSELVPIDREAGLRMYADFLGTHPEVPAQDDVEVVPTSPESSRLGCRA